MTGIVPDLRILAEPHEQQRLLLYVYIGTMPMRVRKQSMVVAITLRYQYTGEGAGGGDLCTVSARFALHIRASLSVNTLASTPSTTAIIILHYVYPQAARESVRRPSAASLLT